MQRVDLEMAPIYWRAEQIQYSLRRFVFCRRSVVREFYLVSCTDPREPTWASHCRLAEEL